MGSLFAKQTKHKIKGVVKTVHLRWLRWRYPFTPEQLLRTLQDLGVKNGDIVLVHSSLNPFAAFSGKPSDIIAVLQQAVGEKGTLLMPALPFSGTAMEWIQQGGTFDARRTPSRTGMVSELFRRMPGVFRSAHPTHSVVGKGPAIEDLCRDHSTCTTPCGRQSPYGRLLDYDGRLLFLGVGIEAMTFFHTAEEILEPMMPVSPFTEATFQLTGKNYFGDGFSTSTYLYNPTLSRRRNIHKVSPMLKKHGFWHEAHLGRMVILLLNCREVLEVLQQMANMGEFCYDGEPVATPTKRG